MREAWTRIAALFRYALGLGDKRADMYDIAVFHETIAKRVREFMFAINMPQESVVIREAVEGIGPAPSLRTDRLEAVCLTNTYLGFS